MRTLNLKTENQKNPGYARFNWKYPQKRPAAWGKAEEAKDQEDKPGTKSEIFELTFDDKWWYNVDNLGIVVQDSFNTKRQQIHDHMELYNKAKRVDQAIAGKGIYQQIREAEANLFEVKKDKACAEITLHKTEECSLPIPEEVKKEPSEVKVEQNPKGYTHDRGCYVWHQHVQYTFGSARLSISDSPGGCGMQQLYDWTSIRTSDEADQLIGKMLEDKHYGVGLIICQLGEDYFDLPFQKSLVKHGFEVTVEYNNLQHGSNYKQRVYSYNVKLQT